MKKLWDLKNVFSNLELEEQGRGIIMGMSSLPITIEVTDAWLDLTTTFFVASITIPVLSSTPFGPTDTSYSKYSAAPGVFKKVKES